MTQFISLRVLLIAKETFRQISAFRDLAIVNSLVTQKKEEPPRRRGGYKYPMSLYLAPTKQTRADTLDERK